jgi:hypothetical protein
MQTTNQPSKNAIRKAIRLLDYLKNKLKEAPDTLTDWEKDFITSVPERITKFGRAFADPLKGSLALPLSRLQRMKARQIKDKTDGKASKTKSSPKGWTSRKPVRR